MKKLFFFILLYCFQVLSQADRVEKSSYLFSHEDFPLDSPDQTTAIVLRFYYLHRLHNPVNLFTQYAQKYFLTEDFFYIEQSESIIVDDIKFEHPMIIKVIKELCTTKKIDPFSSVWKDLESYKYIHDQLLIKEFSILVAYILHSRGIHSFYNYQNSTEQAKKMNVFKSLKTMPIEEVLDILDMLVEEITKFFEIYQLGSNLSWKVWIKKYWPVIPFACAALSIRIYLLYAKMTQKSVVENN